MTFYNEIYIKKCALLFELDHPLSLDCTHTRRYTYDPMILDVTTVARLDDDEEEETTTTTTDETKSPYKYLCLQSIKEIVDLHQRQLITTTTTTAGTRMKHLSTTAMILGRFQEIRPSTDGDYFREFDHLLTTVVHSLERSIELTTFPCNDDDGDDDDEANEANERLSSRVSV